MKTLQEGVILLGHGSGGTLTHHLIQEHLLPVFRSPALQTLPDSAVLRYPGNDRIAFTTDSYVIRPLFFPGGNIGKLAVCGTINDLAVCGAKPLWLSCSLILEEGFPIGELDRILEAMASQAEKAGVEIVTGDTKVVEKNHGDGIYINTAGIGTIIRDLDPKSIVPGDRVLISGTVGDHGTTVTVAREELETDGQLQSDCCCLNHMIESLLQECPGLKFMRDPTRGGLASTLNELVENKRFGILVKEKNIPVKKEVSAICELLGLDPLHVANEGKLLAIVSADHWEKALSVMKRFQEGADAAVIGEIGTQYSGKVVLETAFGGYRTVHMLTGSQLPRIC